MVIINFSLVTPSPLGLLAISYYLLVIYYFVVRNLIRLGKL